MAARLLSVDNAHVAVRLSTHQGTVGVMNASAVRRGSDAPIAPRQVDFDALDDEILAVCGWPERTALIIGASPYPHVLAALRRFSFQPAIGRRENALDLARQTGPFTFLMLGPDALVDPDDAYLIQALRTLSPSARVVLLGSGPGDVATTLVAAIRAGVTEVVDPDDAMALTSVISEQLTMAGRNRERVLAIGAHPDDIEIGCAGTLLGHRRRGDRISLLTLSRGAVGGDRSERAHESRLAADAIGAQLLTADLPDTRIEEGMGTIRLIEAVVRAVDPTVVYVHSRHDSHQDHRAVHTATISAARSVPRVYAYQSPSATNDFQPTRFIAIDEVVSDKLQVLGVFNSQRDRSYLEPELVIAGARYWARHLHPRARYAEPFEVVRSTYSSAPAPAGTRRPVAVSVGEHGASVTRIPGTGTQIKEVS